MNLKQMIQDVITAGYAPFVQPNGSVSFPSEDAYYAHIDALIARHESETADDDGDLFGDAFFEQQTKMQERLLSYKMKMAMHQMKVDQLQAMFSGFGSGPRDDVAISF